MLDRKELEKLLKEKAAKNLDNFNALMGDTNKDVAKALLEKC